MCVRGPINKSAVIYFAVRVCEVWKIQYYVFLFCFSIGGVENWSMCVRECAGDTVWCSGVSRGCV